VKIGNRFRANINEGDKFIGFGHFIKNPITVQPNGLAIQDLLEGKSHNFFCESGENIPDWKVEWAEPDESRNGKKYVYVLKSRGQDN
jgi:hypothetical protein